MKKFRKSIASTLTIAAIFGITACSDANNSQEQSTESPKAIASAKAPTAEEAAIFVDEAEKELSDLSDYGAKIAWVNANFVTEDTTALNAEVGERYTKLGVELANKAKRFNGLDLPYDVARKLEMIKLGLTLPAPSDADKTKKLAEITSKLDSIYAQGRSPDGRPLGQLTQTLVKSRDPAELLKAWQGWREISKPMRPLYEEMVSIANEGSKELGYKDTGAMWRSKYDMPADDFAAELDRLWGQVSPLYDALHCHVRAEMNKQYGDEVVSTEGPMPAHLFGNMWAQQWANIYDIAGPKDGGKGIDINPLLEKFYGVDHEVVTHAEKETAVKKMVKTGEDFFSSLGFDPLPQTFWDRSLFVKPRDRDVQCHASAWDLDNKEDIRIKMCTEINADDFQTVHHELGHNYYQRAYMDQSLYYKNSANDGFHEAIGDTVALSITPKYLKQIGLIDAEPDASADVALLMRSALDKVAFLPFGLLVDQWRWKVFNGEITPENYNQGWWDLREKYQGLKPPVARSESDFDPGAKYHIPGNTPYSRYFLAHILQFQFFRDMCKMSGNEGPLHRCSFYGDKEAGAKLNAMLEMGASRPWPDALEAMTGQREMDATAVLEYYAPLKAWLDEQNKDRQCGW
ncbi:M2 family metallopeptidase [Kangiella sp. HZ709]|uniref:M2 family metallopeptidase n=1 Tax=Kangiella sp. HZ709 TaxID=2666328 RepID=UPI0012AF549F|nr:M2 family metallopeptidase [Kangiella sp. HZ709]MRX26955.1 peptidase M2 family protein [Kangiella sp. HZ709]